MEKFYIVDIIGLFDKTSVLTTIADNLRENFPIVVGKYWGSKVPGHADNINSRDVTKLELTRLGKMHS